MTDIFASIEGSGLAAWTRESPSIWAYPTILTLHTFGLAIVVGANVVFLLRQDRVRRKRGDYACNQEREKLEFHGSISP